MPITLSNDSFDLDSNYKKYTEYQFLEGDEIKINLYKDEVHWIINDIYCLIKSLKMFSQMKSL